MPFYSASTPQSVRASHIQPVDQNDVAVELARGGIALQFRHKPMEIQYLQEARQASRAHNRLLMVLFVLIFDGFYFPMPRLEPEVAVLGAIDRFLILTPLLALFVMADWRGWLKGWGQTAAMTLPILALVINAIEIIHIVSPRAAIDIAFTPLIQLIVITARMSLKQTVSIILVSNLTYIGAITHCPAVPADLLASMSLASLTVSACLLVFAVRVDLRERQVFLLGLQAAQNAQSLADKNQALARLTRLDFLTGLNNRRSFDEVLSAAWQDRRAQGTPLSLVLLDVDHFKAYNDTLGHQAGDACLRRVAAALARCQRGGRDTLARYGGEEFALILPGATLPEAAAVAERLRLTVLEDAIPHPKASQGVTISLGVACQPCGVGDSSQLVAAADACLYAAKRQGRNQVATAPGTARSPIAAAS